MMIQSASAFVQDVHSIATVASTLSKFQNCASHITIEWVIRFQRLDLCILSSKWTAHGNE